MACNFLHKEYGDSLDDDSPQRELQRLYSVRFSNAHRQGELYEQTHSARLDLHIAVFKLLVDDLYTALRQ